MPDTPTFPLLPADRRFWAKRERVRNLVPQPASATGYEQPSSRASHAAERSLRRYMRWPQRWLVPPRRARPAPSALDRLPPRAVDPLTTGVAAGLLPFTLLYFLTCRPGLRGRSIRRRVVTPLDVKKALVVTRTAAAAARVLGKTFARRTGRADGWFG